MSELPHASVAPIEKIPRSSQAYQKIRRDIVKCALRPEMRLRLEFLRQRYGFSFGPLREALFQLSAEGLAISEGQRGFMVARVSLSDLRDITRTRQLIEAQAMRDAIEYGDTDWEANIVAAFYKLVREPVIEQGKDTVSEAWKKLHQDFHFALIAATSSRWLLDLWRLLYDQSERYRNFALSANQTARDVYSEHKELMEETIARNAAGATAALHIHTTRTRDIVIEEINRRAHIGTAGNEVDQSYEQQ